MFVYETKSYLKLQVTFYNAMFLFNAEYFAKDFNVYLIHNCLVIMQQYYMKHQLVKWKRLTCLNMGTKFYCFKTLHILVSQLHCMNSCCVM